MHRTLAAIVLTITALAAVTGCASPAPAAPGEAKENAVSCPDGYYFANGGCKNGLLVAKPTPTDQLIVIDDPMASPTK